MPDNNQKPKVTADDLKQKSPFQLIIEADTNKMKQLVIESYITDEGKAVSCFAVYENDRCVDSYWGIETALRQYNAL